MASGNIDLVRSIYAAWEHGDFSATGWAHPEIEFVYADGPDPRAGRGVTSMAEGWRERASAWEDYRFEAGEYRELDDERILVLDRRSGRGKTSGLEVETRGVTLYHIPNGKVTRLVSYFDRHRGLADLGLAPEAGAR